MPAPRFCRWLLLAMLATAFTHAQAADLDWQSDLDAAWKLAKERQRPLLVFISTSGCRFCTLMQNTTFADPDVTDLIDRGFVPASVDAKDVAWLIKSQRVGSFPTTLVISSDAQVLDKISGYVKPSEMKPRLAKTAAGERSASKSTQRK